MVMPFIAGILKSVDDKKEEFLKAGAKNEAEAGSLAWGVTLKTLPLTVLNQIYKPTSGLAKIAKWGSKKYTENLDDDITSETIKEIKQNLEQFSHFQGNITTIIVQPGDTIWKIARDCNTTVQDIINKNKWLENRVLDNGKILIRPGEKINIPPIDINKLTNIKSVQSHWIKTNSSQSGNMPSQHLLKGEVEQNEYRDHQGGGGSSPQQVDPNDSANLRLQRERLNDPNDNANLRLQREELNDPNDSANLRLLSELLLGAGKVLNNYPPHTENITGEIIPKGQAGKSLYDPMVQDFMDNWPNVKGVIASYEQAIWSKKDDDLMPVHPGITSIASQPFGRTKPFQTPNSQTMQKVLYSGVEYGKDYAKGYLYDRGLELAFGKNAAGKIKKAEGYSNTVRTYAPNAWQAASTVLSRTLNSVGYTIGSIAGWVAQGIDLGIKAIGLIPFIGPGLAAAASAVVYTAGYAIGATLGAASWALTALAALAW